MIHKSSEKLPVENVIHEAKLLEPMSPKLSEKSNVETSPTHTGSETSRSYQPEGKKFLKKYFVQYFPDFINYPISKMSRNFQDFMFLFTHTALNTLLFSYF